MNRWLQKGETFTARGRRGMVARVAHGHVWLTQHRDRKDYLLCADESIVIGNDGPVVVYGLIDSSLQFDLPARANGGWSALVARIA